MLSLGPKKDGGPNAKFFESPDVLTQLDGVKQWLLKNCRKVGAKASRRPSSSAKLAVPRPYSHIFSFTLLRSTHLRLNIATLTVLEVFEASKTSRVSHSYR